MKNKSEVSRRAFIKTSTLASGGIIASTVLPQKVFGATHGWPAINPNIDNLRVVCCHDPAMISTPAGTTFADQNNATNTTKVEANMDEMAKSLAQKATAVEGWATIFRKPTTKEWNTVKCAIKVNCIYVDIMPRIAIVRKVCKELMALGVVGANIVVYDGCSNAYGATKYTPYAIPTGQPDDPNKLPPGVIVSNGNGSLGNGRIPAYIDSVYGSQNCTTHIANGTVDILVNIAVNKAHSSNAAGWTLCLKNHFGTFVPVCGLSWGTSHRYLYTIAINKSGAIIGGDPARQQLCIIDTLWASVNGNMSPVTHTPARIIMGTFCPAVDYLCITKINRDVLGRTLDSKVATIMTDFGYTTAERDAMVLTDVPSASTSPTLSITPTSLTFGAQAGSGNPSAQTVNVTNSGGGTLADITTSIAYGGGEPLGWLSLTASGTGNSQQISNQPMTGSLGVGAYHATVTVNSAGASNTPRTYTVTFNVTTNVPAIALSQAGLTFNATAGGGNPSDQTIDVTNTGGGTLADVTPTITYGNGQPTGWLNIGVVGAGNTQHLTNTATLGTLPTGTYNATVSAASAGASNTPQTYTVTFVVAPAPIPAISFNPASLTFAAMVGGSNPSSQTVNVTNSGTGTLAAIDTTVSYISGSGWLTVTKGGSGNSQTLSNAVALGSLSEGAYNATVTVTSAGAGNSPQTYNVTFNVTPNTTPIMSLNPTSLSFAAAEGGAAPAAQVVNVTNTRGGALAAINATVSYVSGSGWLSVAPGGSGNSQTVTNTASTASMAAGTYTATVSVASTGAGNTPQTYSVTFTVNPATGATPLTGRFNMLKQNMKDRFRGAYTITGRKVSGGQLPAGGIYFKKGQKLNRIK